MKRRKVLTAAGLTTLAPLSGCSSVNFGSEGGNEDTELEIPDSPDEYPVSEGDLSLPEFEPGEKYIEFDIQSREGIDDAFGPHGVSVWNATVESAVSLGIIDVLDTSVHHHESYKIPHNQEIFVSLLNPSKYILNIRVPDRETEQTLLVPCGFFDCNESSTLIGIFDGGQIESTVRSTRAACPGYDC